MMVNNNTALHETAFYRFGRPVWTWLHHGHFAQRPVKNHYGTDNPATRPEELGRPGHIFPLRAKKGGVLRRTGHTEAAVDLARLAGFEPAGVLVEIMNEDGSMARMSELEIIAEKFNLKIVSIKDLIEYRLKVG